jgi:hypothetical protein
MARPSHNLLSRRNKNSPVQKELKRKMRAGGGKQKGARNERMVAERLSMWVTNRKRVDVFWRSAMSGGRTTVYRKTGKNASADSMAGDICATNPLGADLVSFFVIECKHYKDIQIDRMCFGRRGWILREWEKLLRTCSGEDGTRQPFFLLRQNCQPEIVITSRIGYKVLRSGGNLPLLATFPPAGMWVVLFRDVLMLDYSRIKSVIRRGGIVPPMKDKPRNRLREGLL